MKGLLPLTFLTLAAGCLPTSGTFPGLGDPVDPTPSGPDRTLRNLDGLQQSFDSEGVLRLERQHHFEYARATDETPTLVQVTEGDELFSETRSEVAPSGLPEWTTRWRSGSDSLSYTEYEWDLQARVPTESRSFHGPPGSDEDELRSRSRFVWDDNDVLVASIREDYEQTSGQLEYRRTTRPFPPTGRPRKTAAVPVDIPEREEWLLPDGSVQRWNETTFNEEGLPVRTDSYDADGQADEPSWWAGTLDGQGRVDELQSCDGEGNCFLLYTFVYDEVTGLLDRVISPSQSGPQAMRWLWALHPLGGAPAVWPYLLDEETGAAIQTPCVTEWSTEVRVTTCSDNDSPAYSVTTLPQEIIELPEL